MIHTDVTKYVSVYVCSHELFR